MRSRLDWRTFVAVLILATPLSAADWPQWRGPERNGISRETGLLREWPEAGPRLVWQKSDLGGGYSTPAIVGDRIYLINNRGNDNEFVHALSAADGSPLWSTTIGKVGNPTQRPPYPGARSTPTVDGDLLYVLDSDGDLACLETEGGAIRWQKNVRTGFGGRPGEWAYSESPLIDGDTLVCTPGGAEATLVALNKHTGELIWKSAVPGGDQAAYSSIVISETDGLKQYVQFLQKGVVGVDAASGKYLWRYGKTSEGSPANIPTPVTSGNLVYTASNRGGSGLVRFVVTGEGVVIQELYFNQKLPKSIGGSVLVDEMLYGTNENGLLCTDFETGEIAWQDRAVGASSIVFADGLLFLHGENNDVALVEATPDEFRLKGKFALPGAPDKGRSKAWGYPAIANGKLYIHDFGALWCYDIAR